MRLHFLGAAQTVTGSLYYLEARKQRFIVDAGLYQGAGKHTARLNHRELPCHPRHLDGIILTHAHIDHSGFIPRLVAEGFRGPIYATPPTIDLCRIVLPDAGTLQEEDVRYENKWRRKAGKPLLTPLYTRQHAEQALRSFERLPYEKRVSLGRDVHLTFHDAGHILGSAVVELEVEGSRLVFTGDLGSARTPILPPPTTLDAVDYLVCESTYGDRQHDHPENREEQLAQLIDEARGPIVIPAFALERTQDLLYDLAKLLREGRLAPLPIYVDSPMAVSATDVFTRHQSYLSEALKALMRRGENPWEMPTLRLIRSIEESQALNQESGRCIIISASGMCEGGRVRHHLYHHLPQSTATVIFVGYQAHGTLGRRIRDGAASVSLFGEPVEVKARVAALTAYSAHADASTLLDWIGAMAVPPAYTFITHGEPAAAQALSERLGRELGLVTVIPTLGQAYELLPASSGSARLEPQEFGKIKQEPA